MRLAVITGASGAIGKAISTRLYKDGYAVADMSSKTCDVTDEAGLQAFHKAIGPVSVLVTCAAAPTKPCSTVELSLEQWRTTLSVDLDGVFLCCKVFGADMVKGKWGRIVNLTSYHTVATYPNRAAYCAAKSGVVGLTQALAIEWGKYGVTANAVAPGPIISPRTKPFLDGMVIRSPNNRLGTVDEVAALVSFLCSEEAGHINGQEIVIDGGWTKNAFWGDV